MPDRTMFHQSTAVISRNNHPFLIFASHLRRETGTKNRTSLITAKRFLPSVRHVTRRPPATPSISASLEHVDLDRLRKNEITCIFIACYVALPSCFFFVEKGNDGKKLPTFFDKSQPRWRRHRGTVASASKFLL